MFVAMCFNCPCACFILKSSPAGYWHLARHGHEKAQRRCRMSTVDVKEWRAFLCRCKHCARTRVCVYGNRQPAHDDRYSKWEPRMKDPLAVFHPWITQPSGLSGVRCPARLLSLLIGTRVDPHSPYPAICKGPSSSGRPAMLCDAHTSSYLHSQSCATWTLKRNTSNPKHRQWGQRAEPLCWCWSCLSFIMLAITLLMQMRSSDTSEDASSTWQERCFGCCSQIF